jgi:stage V sporulation protein D (sporulation-specific penicillin-binding protein)
MARKRVPPAVGLPIIQRRIIAAFAIVVMLFSVLAFRIGYISVVATDTYASKAAENQIKDEIIPARRGDILDRNGKELAVSIESYTIYLRLKPYEGDKTDAGARKEQLGKAVTLLSETLGLSSAAIEAKMDTDSSRIRVAKGVDRNTMDVIAAEIEKSGMNVVEVEEKSTRDYPLGAKTQKKFSELTTEEQTAYLSEMWRNPTISDLYEPGSVFKLVTVAAALEEGAVTPGTTVNCAGAYQVQDRTIH